MEKPADHAHFYKAKSTNDHLQSYCKACHGIRNRRWALENADLVTAARREREATPESRAKALAKDRQARAADPEKHRLKVRVSYYRNHEKRLAARRAAGMANRARESKARLAWGRANPLMDKMTRARLRARRHGSTILPVVVERVIARHGMTCGICACRVGMRQLVFDHIIALSAGGEHSEANLQVAHYECNRSKGARVDNVLPSEH